MGCAAPVIKGRTGWYPDQHLIRLNLISRMLERGYTFATIGELLAAAHHGMTVEHVLRGPTRRKRRARSNRLRRSPLPNCASPSVPTTGPSR